MIIKYNYFDNHLQYHCNKILGTVHNGLLTEANGLLTKVQATTPMMAYRHPSNASLEDWYEAAKNVNQNHTANEAFKSAYQAPGPTPACLTSILVRIASQSIFHLQAATPAHSTPGNHVSTDIDRG